MKTPRPDSPAEAVRVDAANWTVRRDRGLSAAESIEFELWLAADPRHAAAMRRSAGTWSLLDRIPESAAVPVLTAGRRHGPFWRRSVIVGTFAAAAALALVAIQVSSTRHPPSSPISAAAEPNAGPRQLTLSDGTIVQLNTGARVTEQFTATERRVILTHGEAHFAVTKNPARPFIVHTGNLDVRAVGTAFNVNLQPAAVDVLVTEGTVELKSSAATARTAAPPAPIPLLNAGQRALVALAPASPSTAVQVTAPSADEIAATLAWQAPLLRLGGATLAELVLEFQRRSGRRVILADPSLAQLRVGGRFRADDADGFARLMATALDLEVEPAPDGTLVLRKKKPEIR